MDRKCQRALPVLIEMAELVLDFEYDDGLAAQTFILIYSRLV
ncbi:hypothetical protein [Paenibacillus sp. GCM10028914]